VRRLEWVQVCLVVLCLSVCIKKEGKIRSDKDYCIVSIGRCSLISRVRLAKSSSSSRFHQHEMQLSMSDYHNIHQTSVRTKEETR
jgi:hypothetical protein